MLDPTRLVATIAASCLAAQLLAQAKQLESPARVPPVRFARL